jgi:hypothetical protein
VNACRFRRNYATKHDAKQALGRFETFRRGPAGRVYRCDRCGWWHMSIPTDRGTPARVKKGMNGDNDSN